MTPNMTREEIIGRLQLWLGDVSEMFAPDCRLTLLLRHTEADKTICLTTDDLELVEAAIIDQRYRERPQMSFHVTNAGSVRPPHFEPGAGGGGCARSSD